MPLCLQSDEMNSFMKLYRYLKKVSIFVKKMKNPLKKNIFDFCLEYDFLMMKKKLNLKNIHVLAIQSLLEKNVK